ncbi:MAG: glutathione synthase [Myxococcota bacterium]|nr:glutathione synthase [Myxococcota bacterium]
MYTLFIMDPIDALHLDGDSTYAIMAESTARGFSIAWCTPADLFADGRGAIARCQSVTAHLEEPAFRDREAVREVPLTEFDCVWLRKDPPFDMTYVFVTYLLDLASSQTLVLNDPLSLKCANEKMYALQWPELCPPTLVTNRIEDVRSFAREHERIVVKPWDGNGGRGVMVTEHGDGNLAAMVELLTDSERNWCIAQRYEAAIRDTGDKRIILIDGEVRGWFSRIPGTEDHRGNMHVGARVEAAELTERDREICESLSGRLRAEGLLFTGIDVIGDFLTEINVTSPTGLREILTLQGRNLAAEICDRAQALHQKRRL